MSNYKNGRIPKTEYLIKMGNREKSCHKKKMRKISKFNNGLVSSKDREGNLCCAGCKMILIPKNVSGKEYNTRIIRLYKMGGCYNCCYDCEFSSYCNKCVFTYLQSGDSENYFPSCPHSFIKQVKNNNYGAGKYSKFGELDYECFSIFYRNDIHYGGNLYGQFVDLEFLLHLYEEDEYAETFKYYRQAVKSVVKNLVTCDTSLETTDYEDYNITREKVYKKYKELDKKVVVTNSRSNDVNIVVVPEATIPAARPEMKGVANINIGLLESIIRNLRL